MENVNSFFGGERKLTLVSEIPIATFCLIKSFKNYFFQYFRSLFDLKLLVLCDLKLYVTLTLTRRIDFSLPIQYFIQWFSTLNSC